MRALTYSSGVAASAVRSDGPTVSASLTSAGVPSVLSVGSDSTSFSYNSWLGVTQTTGPNGEQMYMTYDTNGRPLTATSPYGTYGTPTVTYAYTNQANGNGATQTATGPDGFTKTTLDGLGRTVKVERGTNATNIQSAVDTVYAACACSPLGKLKSVSQPHAPTDPVYSTVYSYDGIGRTLSVQQPDGASTTTYAYSGNQTTVTDPAGKSKTFTSDVLGNLTMVTEPNPASGSGGTLNTYYSYDWMNHLACVDMTRGGAVAALYTYTSGGVTCVTGYTGGTRQTRTFVYDDAGHLTSATNPENGTVTYTYNADNTLLKKHDAKGQDTVYTYDANQHVTEVQRYPTGQSGAEDVCQQVNYTYGTDAASYTSAHK